MALAIVFTRRPGGENESLPLKTIRQSLRNPDFDRTPTLGATGRVGPSGRRKRGKFVRTHDSEANGTLKMLFLKEDPFFISILDCGQQWERAEETVCKNAETGKALSAMPQLKCLHEPRASRVPRGKRGRNAPRIIVICSQQMHSNPSNTDGSFKILLKAGISSSSAASRWVKTRLQPKRGTLHRYLNFTA